MTATTTTTTTRMRSVAAPRVAVLVLPGRSRPAIAVVGAQIVASASALEHLARGHKVDAVAVASVNDLGATPAAVLRSLATMAEAGVTLTVEAEGISPANCTPLLRAAASIVAQQRQARLDKAKSGRADARARGVQLGRPSREVDVARARDLLAERQPLRAVARTLGVSPRCLRRRLAGATDRSVVQVR